MCDILVSRERLRLRQEQMRSHRTASSSTNVSAVPSAVVSGVNSPLQSPSSPVTVPRTPAGAGTLNTRSSGDDGVMTFEVDIFENSFDD